MENKLKNAALSDIGNDALRQYIDAQSTFTAWEEAVKRAMEVRGRMFWRQMGGTDYLIKESRRAQTSLGPRSPEREAIFKKFTESKAALEDRRDQLAAALVKQQRLNRALFVGRTPQILVDILSKLAKHGIAEHFRVIGTHALYAYEAAAGVRFEATDVIATRDVDLLRDTRKRIQLATRLERIGSSMLGVLQRVDKSFALRNDRKWTAVNGDGFEVDILRRQSADGEPNPLSLTAGDEDFVAVQARRANVLLDSPDFSAMIVSPSGHMARMRTISPIVFAEFKRWMAALSDRDPLKVPRDLLQAEGVDRLVDEYMPHVRLGE